MNISFFCIFGNFGNFGKEELYELRSITDGAKFNILNLSEQMLQ